MNPAEPTVADHPDACLSRPAVREPAQTDDLLPCHARTRSGHPCPRPGAGLRMDCRVKPGNDSESSECACALASPLGASSLRGSPPRCRAPAAPAGGSGSRSSSRCSRIADLADQRIDALIEVPRSPADAASGRVSAQTHHPEAQDRRTIVLGNRPGLVAQVTPPRHRTKSTHRRTGSTLIGDRKAVRRLSSAHVAR